MPTLAATNNLPLGSTIPPDNTHAISVSLPTWSSTLGWATRDPATLNKMKTGYPRFFVHRDIVTLSDILVEKSAWEGKSMLGLLTAQKGWAEDCARYLNMKLEGEDGKDRHADGGVKTVAFAWDDLDGDGSGDEGRGQTETAKMGRKVQWEKGEVHLVVYPDKLKGHAKDFWQHTGWGISSRYAQILLARVRELKLQDSPTHGSNGVAINGEAQVQKSKDENGEPRARLAHDIQPHAEEILRQRISQLTSNEQRTVSPSDVYLYPTGMTAIGAIAQVMKSLFHQRPLSSSRDGETNKQRATIIIYGFLYLDTFKLLSKIHDFDLHLLGHSSAAELTSLATSLRTGALPNVLALFCEFPGNPLLRTPDLARIRSLADEHGFMVVCDDTVGTSVNVDILGQVDILASSLTKIFSGGCDVMGGSLVLNAASAWYGEVKRHDAAVTQQQQGTWYPGDAATLELNSRDLARRMQAINRNARRVYEMLLDGEEEEEGGGGGGGGVVRQIFYPLGSDTQALYDRHARRAPSPSISPLSSAATAAAAAATADDEEFRHPQQQQEEDGAIGYGYLLSLTFRAPAQAIAFYDALDVAKGPSLGTNFTLACAYTLFAHYGEREWAAGFGVEEHLVRVSVGMEGWEEGAGGGLRGKFERALRAAEAVGRGVVDG